jgi:putative transcriptional regulator
MKPAAGMLLVASTKLTDPNFLHAVVYLLDHGDTGTLGFIINRPLEVPLSELWGEVPVSLADARVAAEGGPVDRHKGLLLHRCVELDGAQPMADGFAVGGELAALAERYAAGNDATGPRLFLGHSGWAPGQLLAELEEGAWIVRPGRPELLVNPKPPATLWEQLAEGRVGGMPDPSVN